MLGMKVDSLEGLLPDVLLQVVDGNRDDPNQLPLGDVARDVMTRQLKKPPCLHLVLDGLLLIVGLVGGTCATLFLCHMNKVLSKLLKRTGHIHMRLEPVKSQERPPVRVILQALQQTTVLLKLCQVPPTT